MKWSDIETAAEFVNINIGESPINTDRLLDEVCWEGRFIAQQAGNWEKDYRREEKCVRVFKHFNQQNIPFQSFESC